MYDCVLIGSGCASLAAALYLKRGGMNILIIENNMFGGELVNIPLIENYMGFTNIEGVNLALRFKEQIEVNDIQVYYDNIIEIKHDGHFKIHFEDTIISSKRIIIGTGQVPKKLNVDGEGKFLNRGIHFCGMCDGSFYKNKVVAVIGGGSSAASSAIYLSNIATKVYIVARSRFKCDKVLVSKINDIPNIIVIENRNVLKYIGTTKLEGISLEDEILYVDGVFLEIGRKPNTSIIYPFSVSVGKTGYENYYIELSKNGYIKVDDKYKTNMANLYAIGDVIDKKYRQISLAISDGIICALGILEE